MASISRDLQGNISASPEENFAVLITLKNESLPPELRDKGKFILGNKVLSATISGKEIQALAGHENIEAIEPDTPMSIL